MKKIIVAMLLLAVSAGAFAQKNRERKLKSGEPIRLRGEKNITISGESIVGDDKACIDLRDCENIHITHCKLSNSKSFGVQLYNCSNILIDSNYIVNVRAGVYVQDCPQGQIRVAYNVMLNMQGPYPQASFVQFNHVEGRNNRISYNKLENIQGQSQPEDAINVYKSNGVEGDPIRINNNWIKGGGPSLTGAGVTLGDQGGSYEVAENNTIINTGSVGMQVAGGSHIQIINNSIYGKAFPWSHLGLGCGNFSGKPIDDITISGNKVRWVSGKLKDQLNGSVTREMNVSYQRTLAKPNGWETNVLNADVNEDMPAPKIALGIK